MAYDIGLGDSSFFILEVGFQYSGSNSQDNWAVNNVFGT